MCSISMCSSRYRNQASLLEVRMGSVFTGRYRGFRRDVADGGRSGKTGKVVGETVCIAIEPRGSAYSITERRRKSHVRYLDVSFDAN
jgi:hypothetical protein